MLDLQAIKDRTDGATSGQWSVSEPAADGRYQVRKAGSSLEVIAHLGAGWRARQDAAFIAHAREDVPALMAEIERIKAALRGAVRDVSMLGRDPDEALWDLVKTYADDGIITRETLDPRA